MSTGPTSPASVDLTVRIGELELRNPVMPASGTYEWQPGDGHPLNPDELGAVVTKSITAETRTGNRPHRIYELRGAVLNSIGIPSPGFDYYRDNYLRPAEQLDTRFITSIAGFSPAEFGELCRRLDPEPRVDAIELNLSCPNIETDSIFATDATMMRRITREARRNTGIPLIAKLSPNVTDIRPFIEVAEGEGMDGLCIANTFTGMTIDIDKRVPILGNIRGGVTGPGLLPIILHHVWTAAQHTRLPIVASGGIYQASDALQYLLAGAVAVQVGTANFKYPLAMRSIIDGIADHLSRRGITCVSDIIGMAKPVPGGSPDHAAR